METALLAICVLLMAAIAAMLVRNLLRRNWDLLSWRNLFLIGYAHFVLLSGYFTVKYGWGAMRHDVTTSWAIGVYAVAAPLFLGVFLICCHAAAKRGWFQRLIPRLELPVTTPAILVSIGALLSLALIMAAVPMPAYLMAMGAQQRSGMATVAIGLATYWALCHRFNPASWALLLGTVGLGVLISVVGGIGRRDAIAALLAIPWMWYFASLRYRSAASIGLFVGGLIVAGIVFIAAYTVVRFEGVRGEKGPGVSERLGHLIEVVTNPQVTSGAVENMLYTDTASNTMFIFNQYPQSYEYIPGRTAEWVLVNPIPRTLYPGKPDALGIILQEQMNQEANLGPGVLGQAWTEGGFLALPLFAVFFGLLYGVMDRALRDRCWNPFFVAVAGASTGNVLAMARGDVGLFFIQIMAGMISSAFVLIVVNVLFGPVARAFPVLRVAGAREANDPHAYDSEMDDGADAAPDGGAGADGESER